jgi:nucleoside-diphosphate-sugar epimerase
MTVLLAGCGDLGTEAGLRFAAAGHRVVGWRRSPEKLPAEIEGAAADLTSGELPPVPADTTAVVVAIAADSPTEEAYRAAYVEGLAHVLDAVAASGAPVRRILFVSSTAVYGDADGGWVDETTTPNPAGFSGRIICEAEELLLDRLRGTGMSPVVLRLGGIYGPGQNAFVRLLAGRAHRIDKPGHVSNRIHAADIAQAIEASFTRRFDGVVNVTDGMPADPAEQVEYAAKLMGIAPPPLLSIDEAKRTFSPILMSFYDGCARVKNERLRSALGVTLRYPDYRAGLQALLDEGFEAQR